MSQSNITSVFMKCIFGAVTVFNLQLSYANPPPARTRTTQYLNCNDTGYRCDQNQCDLIAGQRGTNNALILSHGPESRSVFLRSHPIMPVLYMRSRDIWYSCSSRTLTCTPPTRRGTNGALILPHDPSPATIAPARLLATADQVSYQEQTTRCRGSACRAVLNHFMRAAAPFRNSALPQNFCTSLAPDSDLRRLIPNQSNTADGAGKPEDAPQDANDNAAPVD